MLNFLERVSIETKRNEAILTDIKKYAGEIRENVIKYEEILKEILKQKEEIKEILSLQKEPMKKEEENMKKTDENPKINQDFVPLYYVDEPEGESLRKFLGKKRAKSK